MTVRRGKLDNERQIRSARLASRCLVPVAAAAVMPILAVIAAGVALAQTAPPQPSLGLREQPAQQGTPPPPNPPAAQQSPSPPENPGLINEMGKLFEKSLSILPPLKTPGETIDDLNARAKDAGEALSRLAKPGSMVSGRVTGLQVGCRQALPEQGLQGGQKPQHRFRPNLFGQSADPWTAAQARRLPHRQLRHDRALPVGAILRVALVG